MRPSLKIALLFVGVWFIGKMIFFYGQIFQDAGGVKFLVMWNILCLLLAMSIGTLVEKRREDRSQSTALGDIKNAMGGGMLYTVIVSLLLYVYYAKIDPAYNERQIAVAEMAIRKAVTDPKKLREIKDYQPEFEPMTNDEIIEKMSQSPKAMFSAGSTMTLSLLGMLLLTTINAIVLTVVYRRVLFKQRTL